MNKKFLFAAGCLAMLTAALAWADNPPTYPAWWISSNIAAEQPPSPSNATLFTPWMQANYAPANLGQLKNFAKQAQGYLNTQLSSVGGAGPQIDALVAGFTGNTAANFAPITLGQLKYVANPFYDRLLEVGYDTKYNLNFRITGNGSATDWTYNYPWNPTTATSDNYAAANLGQLKLVFSFDLSSHFDITVIQNALANGWPNLWLAQSGVYPYSDPEAGGGNGGAGGSFAFLDEFGDARGHEPESLDDPAVALVVYTPLQ